MKTVRIIGVPEHFNFPWHMALEEGAFKDRGIDLQWTDIPEGTGKMCSMLRNGETDLAVILTEGIIKDIIAANPSKIAQVYVASPLLWGIHVNAASDYKHIEDLENKRAAISRYGSGSHLMSYVHAHQQGWELDKLSFEVINHLAGGVKALTRNEADYFMWEHFTTKPLVDNGTFRRLGDCPTPWPCFVIAARTDFTQTQGTLLKHLLEVINTYTSEFKNIPSIDRTIANTYQQQLKDVQEWLNLTQWGQENLSTSVVDSVQTYLKQLNLIDKPIHFDQLLTNVH